MAQTPLSLREILESRCPEVVRSCPAPLRSPFISLAERLMRLREIREFFWEHAGKGGDDLLDEGLEMLAATAAISLRDRRRIPHEGRLVVVSNHPLGGLDGLLLLRCLREVRPDVRIVANDLLGGLPGLGELFLPYDIFSKKPQKARIEAISGALEGEEAVVFFPSAEVARLTWRGVREREWHSGAVHFARKHSAPVLPVHVEARNSWPFLLLSLFSQKLSMALLPRELFTQRGKTVPIRVGDLVPAAAFTSSALGNKTLSRLLQKHLERVSKGRRGVFKTESAIGHPVERGALRKDLARATSLGVTAEGKRVLLASGAQNIVLREVGRLRESTFRKVGEGTGHRLDLDAYDSYYRHLLLWDEAELEIAGAYRIGDCAEILASRGPEGLYCHSLFRFGPEVEALLPKAAELGRSFIQPRYWNSRALDQLWQGIGAFLLASPDVRYLTGCVSISATYPEPARDLLVHFFRTWYGKGGDGTSSRDPYRIPPARERRLMDMVPGADYKAEFRAMKETLRQQGCTVPTLYRQYAELCEPGGVRFYDFGIDRGFGGCVDGFIVVDLEKLTPEKRARYLTPRLADTRRAS